LATFQLGDYAVLDSSTSRIWGNWRDRRRRAGTKKPPRWGAIAAALGGVIAFIVVPPVTSADTEEAGHRLFLQSPQIVPMAKNGLSFLSKSIVINNFAPDVEIAPAMIGEVSFDASLRHSLAGRNDVPPGQFSTSDWQEVGVGRTLCVRIPSDVSRGQPSGITKTDVSDVSSISRLSFQI
jgi:hypothetical protein